VSEYLNIIEQPTERKTKVFYVYSKTESGGRPLCEISFYPQWRKYVMKVGGIVFDVSCLEDIISHLKIETGIWKNSLGGKQ